MLNNRERILPLTIFLISFYILLLEILLTRIFSVLLYYHFAFMAISMALLGLGTSSMAIYFFPDFFSRKNTYNIIPWAFLLFASSLILIVFTILLLKIEIYLTITSIFKLILLYISIFIPFFFGGLIISLILSHFPKKVSKLYFYDLIGASLGTVSVIPLLKLIGGPNSLIFISFIGLLAAIITSFYYKLKKIAIISIVFSIITLILLLIGIIYNPFTLDFTKGHPDAIGNEIKEFSAWNAISRVDLFNKGKSKYILIDSDAFTEVVKIDKTIKEKKQLTNDLGALAYYINPNAKVLIIGAGGGVDVLRALLFNSTVTGVEINEIIVDDLMKGKLKNFSGSLYFRDDVNVIIDEGRSFIRRSNEKYDVIQMSLVDTWAATAAGAFTLTENNLYTVEAFVDYLNSLTDNGIFSNTRWEFAKPQETIRLTAIALEALEKIGIKNPEKNIIIIKQNIQPLKDQRTPFIGVANFMIKKSAFTKDEIDILEKKAEEYGFEVLYGPDNSKNNIYNELIRSENKKTFYETYQLDITPTYDDRPFFFYTLKLKDALNFFKLFSGEYEKEVHLKTNLGLFLLLITFIITFALASLFILVPLILKRFSDLRTNKLNKFMILLYFIGLGVGFILIEIILMQKFILFLGHPIYSLSVTLFSLLVFSGIGSLTTKFTTEEKIKKHISINLILLLIVIILYLFLLPIIFNSFIVQKLGWRIIIAIILLLPVGLILGRFFPLGIKLIDKVYHNMIPWAWGLNGTTSVVGSVVALILAINFGFNLTLLIGTSFYLFTLGLIIKRI